MVSEITAGIGVAVETIYQEEQSQPSSDIYLFAYKVTIHNSNPYTVQLLSRKWLIINALGEREVVEGQGVIGQQPIMNEGSTYEYVSGCKLSTPLGTMQGTYYFENKFEGNIFQVKIPLFKLEADFILN